MNEEPRFNLKIYFRAADDDRTNHPVEIQATKSDVEGLVRHWEQLTSNAPNVPERYTVMTYDTALRCVLMLRMDLVACLVAEKVDPKP